MSAILNSKFKQAIVLTSEILISVTDEVFIDFNLLVKTWS